MSTHNMFPSRNKKTIDTFWLKKAPYQELCIIIYWDIIFIFLVLKFEQVHLTTC